MNKVWSVVVRRDNDPIGHAVPYQGETEFIDAALAYDVWEGVLRQFGFMELPFRAPTQQDDERGVRSVVTGRADGDDYDTHIEIICEDYETWSI